MNDNDLRNMFTAWVEKVIDHSKIDYQRRKSAKKRQANTATADWEIQSQSYEQDFRLAPQNEFDFAEERLADSFASLPLLRQRILQMTFIEDMSPSEIAVKLNCSVDYVYLQKHRALRKLNELLNKGGADGEI